MKRLLLMLFAPLACAGDDDPIFHSTLETSAGSYVAVDDPDPRYDYAVTVVLTIRNTSDQIVRVSDCSATAKHPPYAVQPAGEGTAAWNPTLTCALSGVPVRHLLQGEERTDTLLLRSPQQRLFNGQPVGVSAGRFHVVYETRICGSVSASGNCLPSNAIENVRSNSFTITTP